MKYLEIDIPPIHLFGPVKTLKVDFFFVILLIIQALVTNVMESNEKPALQVSKFLSTHKHLITFDTLAGKYGCRSDKPLKHYFFTNRY